MVAKGIALWNIGILEVLGNALAQLNVGEAAPKGASYRFLGDLEQCERWFWRFWDAIASST
ncbi:MAG: hypothetical protein ACFCUV_00400 [Rivularia sp. (in: cyanobacteria)]